MSDKTEEPTPKRLRKAREEGDSGASAFASQPLALVIAVVLLPATLGAVASTTGTRLREAIEAARSLDELRAAFAARGVELLTMSAATGEGVGAVLEALWRRLALAPRSTHGG